MQMSSRFPVAVQILIMIAWTPEEYKLTSEVIAQSVRTNPVMIRRIMGYLKKSGLVSVSPGKRGIKLARNPNEITLLDVYQAVEINGNDSLFGLHPNPNPRCPIGSRINDVLAAPLDAAQKALEDSLAGVTIDDLRAEFPPFSIPDGYMTKAGIE